MALTTDCRVIVERLPMESNSAITFLKENYEHSPYITQLVQSHEFMNINEYIEYIELNLPVTFEILLATYYAESLNASDGRPLLGNREFKHIPFNSIKSLFDIERIIGLLLDREYEGRANVMLLGDTESGKNMIGKLLNAAEELNEEENSSNISTCTEQLHVHKNIPFRSGMNYSITLDIYNIPGHNKDFVPNIYSLQSCIYVIVVDGVTYENDKFHKNVAPYIDVIYSSKKKGYIMIIFTKGDVVDCNEDGTHKLNQRVNQIYDMKEIVQNYIKTNYEETMIKFKDVYEVSSHYNSMVDVFLEKFLQLFKDDLTSNKNYLEIREVKLTEKDLALSDLNWYYCPLPTFLEDLKKLENLENQINGMEYLGKS